MLNELDWLLNLTLLALGLGAFFINQLTLLRFAAISACSLLFLSFSLDSDVIERYLKYELGVDQYILFIQGLHIWPVEYQSRLIFS